MGVSFTTENCNFQMFIIIFFSKVPTWPAILMHLHVKLIVKASNFVAYWYYATPGELQVAQNRLTALFCCGFSSS